METEIIGQVEEPDHKEKLELLMAKVIECRRAQKTAEKTRKAFDHHEAGTKAASLDLFIQMLRSQDYKPDRFIDQGKQEKLIQ